MYVECAEVTQQLKITSNNMDKLEDLFWEKVNDRGTKN
jgi:hypothetical protein